MHWQQRIADVQRHLREEKSDGWLLYDFQEMNPLARAFLALPAEVHVTRRFLYWIPQEGEPIKIVHAIETHVLDHLPGSKLIYLKWEEFEKSLQTVLRRAKKVSMEFSERCSLPYVSKVDAGLIDLIRTFDVEVVSSASFLQNYTCVLDDEQLDMQIQAGEFLSQTAEKTWEKIASSLRTNQSIDEYQVSAFILEQFASQGYQTEGRPLCAVNAHSADPHYAIQKQGSTQIRRGDFILIDLWCKKNHKRAVYADITRVAYAGDTVPDKHVEIFRIVREAQRTATDFVTERYELKKHPKGFEVDEVCRGVIEKAGYGQYFTHRTGHNIYTKTHGPGAHIDSLETRDFRTLIPRTCFSIEPGIYLPGEFGVRLEYDIVTLDAQTVRITGGIQEAIVTLD